VEDYRRSIRPLRPLQLLVTATIFVVAASQLPTAIAAPTATLRTARQALLEGRLNDAKKALRGRTTAKRKAEHQVLTARLALAQTDYAAVIKRLTPLVKKHPDAYEARVVLGRALAASGENRRAFEVLDAMAEDYNDGTVTDAKALLWLGVGLHLTDYVKNANQVFQEALEQDTTLDLIRRRWAELFVSKYNYRDSDALYQEILAKNPNDIGAQVGRARIAILSDRDFTGARKTLDKVFAAVPDHLVAHTLMALIELENERPRAAAKILMSKVLAVAPRDHEALALLGASYYVADDDTRYKATEKKALGINPRFAGFYTTVAGHAARVHRYTEAIALHKRALTLDKEHYRALAGLGIGYSRVGDDAKAQRYLQEAYDSDPYDVRTFNLLTHFYDDVDKHFEWVEAKPMRIRVNKSERPMLERYVPELLGEAYAALTKKYKLEPALPLHIEIFDNPQTFAVRSTGLPQLSAHGICFGHVVTSRSPSEGNFNWAEVLWHELSHVFHIELSKSRVPRWFTEGLAVFESTEARANWRREMDETLFEYHRAKKLRGVGEFNLSFTRATSLQDILVAYFHAYQVVRFIDAQWDFDKMRLMLTLWGDKLPTAVVIKRALGVDLATFDKRFFGWLDGKLAYLDKGFSLSVEAFRDDVEATYANAAKAKGDATAQGNAMLAALSQGDQAKVKAYMAATQALAPKDPRAAFVAAVVAMEDRKHADAKTALEAMLTNGHDGGEIRTRLAKLADGMDDKAGALTHTLAAQAFNPNNERMYHSLIRRYEALAQPDKAFEWRTKVFALDQMNPALARKLLEGAASHGASKDDVLKWGEQALHTAPFDVATHVVFAKELKRLGMAKRARYEAESALLLDPDNAEAKAILAP
jgi:tetratricopeptide (TPR) repeat protein